MRIMKKTFLIIDAFGILYRYHFIFLKRPLLNSKGQNVSSINGFLRVYFSLVQKYQSDYIAVALDSSRVTFRNEIYKEYKENRESMPDDLRSQIPLLYNLIDALGIPRLILDGYEADDIIGMVAKKNEKENIKTIIYSPDKDILQLVNDNTVVISSNKEGELIEYDRELVKERRGVFPEQIIDLLSLMGDASDNIPGVKGVGEKTAQKLLEEYITLDGIYENIDAVQGKLNEKLTEEKEKAYMSKKLATLECGVPLEIDYENLKGNNINQEETTKILAELELNQIKEKVLGYIKNKSVLKEEKENKVKTSESSANTTKTSYYLIENINELNNLLKDIENKKLVCIDFETTGLDPLSDRIIGIAFSLKQSEAFYLDLSGRTDIDKDKSIQLVFDTLAKKDIKIIGHNLKYEYKMLKALGLNFGNLYFDTMIAAYLINPTGFSFSMDALAMEYLKYNTIKYKDLTDNAKLTLLDVPLKDVVEYAAEDADITFRFYETFLPLLERLELTKLFYDIEMPLIKVLGDMEFYGVHINSDVLKTMSKEYEKLLKKTEENIYALAGGEFNVQSPKQLSDILFNKLGIAPIKKTQTGFSTDEEVLKILAEKHKIAEYMLTYRKYAKLKNTYLDVLPTLVHKNTGRIHASFNQTGTATGRLSSSDPNLQNIPARGDEGKDIRSAFTSESGNVLISADYSQIELRLLAHFSEDKTLVEAFKKGEDIHKKTAQKIFSVPENLVKPSMRNTAKIINFSIIYGKTAFGLSKELGISRKQADEFIKSYFATYSSVEPFCKNVVANAEVLGYVRTMAGRIRDMSKTIHSQNAMVKAEAIRIAVNTVIQGSAADLIKIAMVNLYQELEKHFKTAKIVMQVHDELVIEVSKEESDKAMEVVKKEMENAFKAKVPLLVDIHSGLNWGEIH